uniref:RRM domain-containing protein n=1 Tax=Mycena chlorophos TaxID=658473 RepID=A0ABQ0M8R0_MYCCL|nr:predicted protein [Mycena chlorophos]
MLVNAFRGLTRTRTVLNALWARSLRTDPASEGINVLPVGADAPKDEKPPLLEDISLSASQHPPPSTPSTKLFMGDVSSDATVQDLRAALGRYGEIEYLWLPPMRKVAIPGNQHRNYGFVTFRTLEAAAAAYNARIPLGRDGSPLRIQYAVGRLKWDDVGNPDMHTLVLPLEGRQVHHSVVHEVFSVFGDCRVRRRGHYLRVTFERPEDARAARERYRDEGVSVDGVVLPVRYGGAAKASRNTTNRSEITE